MSEYTFRNTPARKLAREMMELKARKPPMISRLTRANSGLRNIYLKSKETGSSRTEIEEAGVLEQCEQVIRPPIPGTSLCWLCGFPIAGLQTPEPPGTLYWSEYLDSAVCEHVLPVRLSGVITGLYNPYGGVSRVGDEHLLHSVYEYSHHLCNLAKSDSWFLSKPDKTSPSYCDLIVNDEKIHSFLDYLYSYTMSPTGRYPVTYVQTNGLLSGLDVDRHESGIFAIQTNTPRRIFDNNVQYYIFQTYRKDDSDIDLNRMKEEWKRDQYRLIEEKTKHLIEKIKIADKCSTDEEGTLYAATMSALTVLEQKGKIERNIGPSRYIFARSPSINSIARNIRAQSSALPKGITAENVARVLGIQPTARNLVRQALSKRLTKKRRNPYSTKKGKVKVKKSTKKKRIRFLKSRGGNLKNVL
jgi:hypothetical protein